MEVPLVDHGALMLRAAQSTPVQPNMGWVLRFDTEVGLAELQQEAARLAASPFALGRRLRGPRVPGARPRWQLATTPPEVALVETPLDADRLATWLDDEVSRTHDLQHGAGWQLSAARTADGGTVVVTTMSHLFGAGKDVLDACFGEQPEIDLDALPAGIPWWLDEPRDIGARLWTGVRGTVRLGREVTEATIGRRRPTGDLGTLARPLAGLRDRDPSRGRTSRRRVAATATVDATAWDERAAAEGGNATTLQVALAADLARGARLARGGPAARPVRLIVPVDMSDRLEAPSSAGTVGPVMLTSATVVLPGGPPVRGDLATVRGATRRALATAARDVREAGRVAIAPGVVDAMKLLPDRVSLAAALAVHGSYDAAASNVGTLPPGIWQLGRHTATDVALLAFPLGSDLSVAMARGDGSVQLSVVAQPSRLGGGPALRDRLAAELDAWSLPAEVR